MRKILTVVVPTYNMEKYLDKCLTSLIVDDADLLDELEVLVINDGSKDRSSEIAHSYSKRYPSTFKVIDKENGHYGSCVNRGLKEATGKYIKILDADDTYDTNNFKSFLEFLRETEADCVISDMVEVNEEGVRGELHSYSLPTDRCFTLEDFGEAANTMCMHSVCYLTSNLRGINYHQTEGILYTDQEWIFLPMAASKKITYFDKIIYLYLVGRGEQSCSISSFDNNFWMLVKSIEILMDARECNVVSGVQRAQDYINSRIKFVAITCYNLFFLEAISNQYNDLLAQFDKKLFKEVPDLYVALGDLKAAKCAYYVRHWRKRYQSDTVYFIVLKWWCRIRKGFQHC